MKRYLIWLLTEMQLLMERSFDPVEIAVQTWSDQ